VCKYVLVGGTLFYYEKSDIETSDTISLIMGVS
jgi:hypothetical protein